MQHKRKLSDHAEMSTRVPNPTVGDPDPREDEAGAPLESGNMSGGNVPTEQLESDKVHAIMSKLIASLGAPKSFGGNVEPRRALLTILSAILTNLKVLETSKAGCTDCNFGVRVTSNVSLWTEWSESVKLHMCHATDPDALSEVERIKRDVKYPQAVKSLETSIDVLEPNMSEFVQDVDTWVRDDPTIQWDMSEDAPRLWECLLNNWSFAKHSIGTEGSEVTQCELVGAMIHLIFYQSVKAEERCDLMLETELALPLPSTNKASKVYCAKADAFVTKVPPRAALLKISMGLVSERITSTWSLQCLFYPLLELHVGVFALAASRPDEDTTERRMGMILCSIQYQRRILGLKNKYIYGATCKKGKLALYASTWKDESLQWMPVTTCEWDLRQSHEFIQCLYFLQALQKHLDESFGDDYDNLAEEVLKRRVRQMVSWRAVPDAKRRDSDENDSDTSYNDS
ncbi:hypothetical protein ACEPAF_1776 [Sanghuangporus sanghuang]